MSGGKNILKEAMVMLLASLMVFSAIVGGVDTTNRPSNLGSNARRNGVAPKILNRAEHQPPAQRGDRGYLFAYDLSTFHTCYFDTSAVIHNLDNPGFIYFTGADMDGFGNWYAVCFDGGLYRINTTTGIPTFIASTVPLNSLTYDSTTSTWFCCGDDNTSIDSLFTMNITTGTTTRVGHFGVYNPMVSVMCDLTGTMYAYDGVFNGSSRLYTIDKLTGKATNPKDMGHTLCYAQEGKFNRSTGVLYLAAYDIGMNQSYLATCSTSSGAVTILHVFDPMDEIDALSIPWTHNQPPNPPIIHGPASGKAKHLYDYMFNATDPNDDTVFYYIDWGDTTNSGWIGPYTSGSAITQSHTWAAQGTFTIQAKAKDIYGIESGWGRLTVTMPLIYEPPHLRFFAWLVAWFPHIFPLLRQLLGN